MQVIQILILKAFIALLIASSPGTPDIQKQEAITLAMTTVQQAQDYLSNVPTSTPVQPVEPIQPIQPVEPLTPPALEPVLGAAPQVEKRLELRSGGCKVNVNGLYCDLYAKYYENNSPKDNVPITFSADDAGQFVVYTPENGGSSYSTSSPAVSWTTRWEHRANVSYTPVERTERTITATINGVTATLKVSGQLPKADEPIQ